MAHNASDIKAAVKSLEEAELADENQSDETLVEIYKSLLVNYMLDDEAMKAKLLWKRIPIVFKSDPNAELNCIGAVVIKLIQREYAQAFRLINEYQSSGRVWSTPTLTALLTRLVAMSRERYFALVSTAYSSIDVDTLAANVGLDAAETCTIAQHSLGWTLDESGKCLLPKKKESTGNFEIANQTQMRQLTSLVSFLET